MDVSADTLYDWQKRIAKVLQAKSLPEARRALEPLEGEIFGAYVDAVKESLGSDTERPPGEQTAAE